MPTRNTYFPARIGDQIIWLRNFRNKIGGFEAPLGYTPSEVASTVADGDSAIYLLDTVNTAAASFAQSITTYIRLALEGPDSGVPSALPSFALPLVPPAPASVAPAALRRLFAFIKNLKTRPAYTDVIGEDLGVIGSEQTTDANAVPEPKVEARSGEVVISFKKHGYTGVWIESQVADETEWSYIAIDTSSPYNDTRPLKVAGQPEKRRYRLCYWDGEPTNNWSDIVEVTYGG